MTAQAAEQLDRRARKALADLLLAMADDEFVLGFWDSEWTGIAPVLEEDVAFASLAQDEIGHAQALYRLLDHPRTDWAFSVARRFLYDTADAARLDALVASAFQPLAGLVAKMRREETYHLLHMHAWMERLANGGDEPRSRLVRALDRLWPDARCVLAGVDDAPLVAAGILAEPLAAVEQRWLDGLAPVFERLALQFPTVAPPAGGCRGPQRSDDFLWLWEQFTMVYRSDPEATW